MHILIVSQYFWPEQFRINDLAYGLRDRGHDVTVLTGIPNYPAGRFFPGFGWFSRGEMHEGIRVVRVPQIPRGNSRGLQLMLNYLSFALLACLLGPFRCRDKYDAIFVFQASPVTVAFPAIVLKWLTRAPILFWVQDLWPESLSAVGAVKSPWLLRQIDRIITACYRQCDRILAQSRQFITAIESKGIPAAQIRYFPNWCESLYDDAGSRQIPVESAEFPPGFRILFAGNIGEAQSFETILAAAELTRSQPDLHWVVLGDGRQMSWVTSEISARGLSGTVHLLGRRPVETMPRYFAAADALLVTLKRDPVFAMTVPSKVQSYLASARPILAALDGEGAEIITAAQAGLVGPTEDAVQLAEHALQLYRMSPADRARLGNNGRAHFEQNFDRTLLLNTLETLFEEVTGLKANVPHSTTLPDSRKAA